MALLHHTPLFLLEKLKEYAQEKHGNVFHLKLQEFAFYEFMRSYTGGNKEKLTHP
jgi:hypothetical protein